MSDDKYVLILTADQRDVIADALNTRMIARSAPSIAIVTGDALDTLRYQLDLALFETRVMIEHGGVKVSTDRRSWTPALGAVDTPQPDSESVLKCAVLKRGIQNLRPDGASAMLTETVR